MEDKHLDLNFRPFPVDLVEGQTSGNRIRKKAILHCGRVVSGSWDV